jgi:predicted RNA-binding Zn-ribbon protein involved in translation (DUF1610 family)
MKPRQVAVAFLPMIWAGVAVLLFYASIVLLTRMDADSILLGGREVFPSFRPSALSTLLSVAVVVIGYMWTDRRDNALRRRVQAGGGAICTHCGYELDREAEETTCPECGRHWNVDAVRRRWRKHGYLKR